MNACELWKLFEETGAPELYLMYSSARKMESTHAFENASSGPAGRQLQ